MTAPRLLIFDFDGVLGDTEDVYHAALAAVVRGEGIELSREEYYRTCVGLPDEGALAAIFTPRRRRLTSAELERFVAQRRREYTALLHRAHLFAGVTDTLRRLRTHCRLAIASGAFRDEIETLLARDQARDLFDAIVAAEDVERGKPAPDPFLRALAEVNQLAQRRGGPGTARPTVPLLPSDCLVIEDAPHGIIAARAAGMRCIGVTTSVGAEVLAGADAVIEHVNRLPEHEVMRR